MQERARSSFAMAYGRSKDASGRGTGNEEVGDLRLQALSFKLKFRNLNDWMGDACEPCVVMTKLSHNAFGETTDHHE